MVIVMAPRLGAEDLNATVDNGRSRYQQAQGRRIKRRDIIKVNDLSTQPHQTSLNPFALPLHLGLFVSSVWALIIVAIATVDDVTKRLPLGESILYLGGLVAVCAVDYVIFSITTLYFIGYPLLIAYYVFAFRKLSEQDSI